MVDCVVEPSRQTPVLNDVEVAVIGGGTAGAIAAIAAARTGVSTILIERFGYLGGCTTIGRCIHVTNRFVDANHRILIGGIPLEVIKRLVEKGGTSHSRFEETFKGKKKIPNFLLVDPEILSIVLFEMIEEAGVNLLLHTRFCEVVLKGNLINAVLVENKAGRQAVRAENVVDASGEADVAYRSDVPCMTKPSADTTFGLLMRFGNVNVDKFLQCFFNLDAGKHNPEFTGWLSRHLRLSAEELRQDRYWRYFLDPQICQSPIIPPQPRTFNAEALRWFKERWEEDGYFAYINMHFFRDLLRQAVENGDLQLKKKINGIGEIGFNFDGFSGGRWRRGQVVLNGIMPMNGFDAFNSEHITKVEITSRKRAFEILAFLKKYMPGFENSYIMDTGFQTMPRHPRMIEGEYKLTMEDIENSERFYDAIYSAAGGENWLPHQVPYRMLLPKKIDNLLVAGKCASGAIYARSIPHAMAQGHVAGTAAALASIKRVPPRQIGTKDLQEILREQGLIIDIPV